MTLQKKDFIEIEFTGKTKEGEIFDSNVKEELEKLHSGHNHPIESEPFIFCLGEGMFLKGIDDFLIGKEIGEYKIPLSPEKAFGSRNPGFIQRIPIKIFKEHNANPVPGLMFNFDGRIGKILAVSGGRVLIDFNNPLAGKDVIYNVRVLRKIEDVNEKIKAFNKFLFKRDLKFEIKDKTLFLEVEKPMMQFVGLFKDKYKDLFNLEPEVKESEEEGKENKREKEKKEKPQQKSQ